MKKTTTLLLTAMAAILFQTSLFAQTMTIESYTKDIRNPLYMIDGYGRNDANATYTDAINYGDGDIILKLDPESHIQTITVDFFKGWDDDISVFISSDKENFTMVGTAGEKELGHQITFTVNQTAKYIKIRLIAGGDDDFDTKLYELYFNGKKNEKPVRKPWSGSITPEGNIYRNGNVGIGTSETNSKLTIKNTDYYQRSIDIDNTNSHIYFGDHTLSFLSKPSWKYVPYIEWKAPNGKRQAYLGWQPEYFNLTLENGYNFSINGGNVGIGTSAPSNVQSWSRVLDVHGAEHSKILATSSTGNVITGIFSHGTNWNGIVGRLGTESNHDLRLMAGYGNDQMTIKTNGNVGIGTTKPTEKLTVKGTILASKIRVLNDSEIPASDYVFEPDYNLRSLKEVETFVKENKHLPEVPSAAEFKENGYSIGEMDDVLLRKIEELTLYSIAQQKEIELLKRENQKLREKDEAMEEVLKRIEALEKK